MTEDQINVAIAMHVFSGEYRVQLIAKPKSYNYKWGSKCMPTPKYASDLNAMHEAEKVLTSLVQQQTYISRLRQLTDPQSPDAYSQGFLTAHATAAQRAEALLRTIGKWKD